MFPRMFFFISIFKGLFIKRTCPKDTHVLLCSCSLRSVELRVIYIYMLFFIQIEIRKTNIMSVHRTRLDTFEDTVASFFFLTKTTYVH